jgi:hypothetical protein
MLTKNMHSRFYKNSCKRLAVSLRGCGFIMLLCLFSFTKIFSQEKSLLDSITLDETYTYMDLKEALAHPEMVIKLELRKQKLKTFPPEIFMFKNLQYLDLGKNQLKELPDSIYKLTQLQHLNVERNKIGMLPKEIGKLTNLTYLNANNNDLIGLPPQIGNLERLHILDVWSNNFSEYPESLSNLKELQVLDIRAIMINQETVKLLHKWLPNTSIHYDPPCNCKL